MSRRPPWPLWLRVGCILLHLLALELRSTKSWSGFMQFGTVDDVRYRDLVERQTRNELQVHHLWDAYALSSHSSRPNHALVMASTHMTSSRHVLFFLWDELCGASLSTLGLHQSIVRFSQTLPSSLWTLFHLEHSENDFVEVVNSFCKRYRRDEDFRPIALQYYTQLIRFVVHQHISYRMKATHVDNAAFRFTGEQLAVTHLGWGLDVLSVVIVLDNKCLSSECRGHSSLHHRSPKQNQLLVDAMDRLAVEIREISTLMTVNVIYGYAFRPSERWLFQLDCEHVQTLLGNTVAIQCAESNVVESSLHRSEFSFASSSDTEGGVDNEDVQIPFAQTYYGDIRETLARYMHSQRHSDVYVLLDLEDVLIQQNPMLLPAITRLLYGSIVPDVGVTVFSSQSLQQLRSEFADVNQPPLSPVVRGSVWDMSPLPLLSSSSFPRSLNNYLLLEMHRVFDAASVVQSVLEKLVWLEPRGSEGEGVGGGGRGGGGWDDSSRVRSYVSHLEEYAQRLAVARGSMREYLGSRYFGIDESEQVWLERDLAFGPGDALWGLLEEGHGTDSRMGMTTDNEYSTVEEGQGRGLERRLSSGALSQKQQQQQQHNMITQMRSAMAPIEVSQPHKAYAYHRAAKVAVITAIYGDYESTCKPFARQTVPTDFICFTNNPQIIAAARRGEVHGWQVDATPYHEDDLQVERELGLRNAVNAFHRNNHTFNIAKYYKTGFHRIPRLSGYDVVVWVDGTVRVVNPEMVREVLAVYEQDEDVLVMAFELARGGSVDSETSASMSVAKYASTFWANQTQPFQNVSAQLEAYSAAGYQQQYWKNRRAASGREHYGVWCTIFVPFNMQHRMTVPFLDLWREQIRQYTTQDQVSFPFVAQQLGVDPYSLPQGIIFGNADFNSLFFKLEHGQ